MNHRARGTRVGIPKNRKIKFSRPIFVRLWQMGCQKLRKEISDRFSFYYMSITDITKFLEPKYVFFAKFGQILAHFKSTKWCQSVQKSQNFQNRVYTLF